MENDDKIESKDEVKTDHLDSDDKKVSAESKDSTSQSKRGVKRDSVNLNSSLLDNSENQSETTSDTAKRVKPLCPTAIASCSKDNSPYKRKLRSFHSIPTMMNDSSSEDESTNQSNNLDKRLNSSSQTSPGHGLVDSSTNTTKQDEDTPQSTQEQGTSSNVATSPQASSTSQPEEESQQAEGKY